MAEMIPDYQTALTYFQERPLTDEHVSVPLTQNVELRLCHTRNSTLLLGPEYVELRSKNSAVFRWYPDHFWLVATASSMSDREHAQAAFNKYTPFKVRKVDRTYVIQHYLRGYLVTSPYKSRSAYTFQGDHYEWVVNSDGSSKFSSCPLIENAIQVLSSLKKAVNDSVRQLLDGKLTQDWEYDIESSDKSTREQLTELLKQYNSNDHSVLLTKLCWEPEHDFQLLESFSPEHYLGRWLPEKLPEVERYRYQLQYGFVPFNEYASLSGEEGQAAGQVLLNKELLINLVEMLSHNGKVLLGFEGI